jgi:ribosomal protein S17
VVIQESRPISKTKRWVVVGEEFPANPAGAIE